MTAPFVLAVPSKGRLQENAEAFFTRAGLSLAKPRGARDYRGTIAGLDHVEIAYLSASEIAFQLARGMVHLGVTGEDLLRETIVDADRRVLLIDNLGFGSANVVVAVPQAWIDVRTMADLDDVTTGFRAQHNRRMRVATKYINLTRNFFATHGVVAPFGGPTSSGMLTLHCPPAQLYALGSFLREHGADTVSVASLDYVLDRENPLFARLEAFLRQ